MGIFNDNSQNNNTGGSGQPGLPGQKGDPGIGFKLTADGNFDINGKLLTNVAGPVKGDDATNKNYVDAENTKQDIAIADKASKNDLDSKLNIDGSNSMISDLNLNNNKVINISGGTNNGDAVNYRQLLSHSSNNHQNNYHLQKSFTFYKNFGDKAQLNIQNINITNHNHHDLLVVKKEGSDPGFRGEAWVSLKMTNDLPAGDYTVIFETFSANIVSASNITFLNNETLLQQVRGDANYKIITFSHDYQTTYSKSYIQFTTNGNAGDITFEIRYYGSSYNNSNLNFLFYSRVVAGRIGYAFNHKIFDIDDVQLNNQILYFEDVNLNGNKIKGLAEPSEDSHAANMKYVNNQIQTQVNSLFSKNSHSYNLQPNFNFTSIKNINIRKGTAQEYDPGHIHGNWYVVKPSGYYGKYYVVGFYGHNNNLKPGNYTALFELFSLYYSSKINDLSTMVFRNEGANLNYKFIQLKSRSVDNNYKKIIMQFEVIRNPGVLRGDLRFLPTPGMSVHGVKFAFFHRIIEGLYDLDFDHGVFDADPQQLFFIDSLSLNNKRLTDVADPTDPKDSANKTYVDDEIAKLPHCDNGILKLDGSRAMNGNLLMAGHSITGLKDPNSSDSNYATSVNFVNKTISDNNSTIVTNYQKYVDDRLKYSVQSADKSNVFQSVMDDPAGQFYDEDDIKGIKKTNKDYHKINKETYEMQLVLDSSGYYSSRLGINMYTLPNGEYSLVYELYYPNTINSSTVQISAVSAVETVSKVTTNVFNNHTRSIIHLHKYNNVAPNRLMIDMVLKIKLVLVMEIN